MEAREHAASSFLPRWPTEKTDATVSEYCMRKVMVSGAEYLRIVFVSVLAVV